MEINGLRAAMVGGASGMCHATARRIVDGGGTVAIIDQEDSDGRAVAEDLGGSWHPCDVMDFDAFEVVFQEAVDAMGGLDAAVNTPGGTGGRRGRTISKTGPFPLDDFRWVIDLNLNATFNLSRLSAWHMSKNEANDDGERGVIINTSSIAAFEGQIGQVPYAAAKAAVSGMTLPMARDLGSLGIRVNTVAPSLFQTGLTAGATPDRVDNLTKDAAFPRRMGLPDEYARLAIAIIENPMLNGDTIRLDGGQRFAPK